MVVLPKNIKEFNQIYMEKKFFNVVLKNTVLQMDAVVAIVRVKYRIKK
ncbi:hypothetical protein [Metamycoplasma hyosynoviae]|uniref:Uncharacterized protein n=1 Tax=Metamycoplasma hyosynoviae TaxID=29559 RepID=A0AAP4AP50_9BACT|nr:hypothetical protein [Metamycoplasma hyosynoviae]MDD1372696.1 hypothetical protein [Metamycoplasma hyosynoviae]MDD7912235.1 hypothetical protein [Metamycoplasma hyosynoviae]MDI3048078.1 hypothetical protein [Metamycoplasma hyosynoviae]